MENYNSRWEYLKNKSPWHFDPQKEATDDWQIISRFEGNWTTELDNLVASSNGGTPLNFLNKLITTNPYTAKIDQADMDTMGLKQDAVFLNRILPPFLNRTSCPLIYKMIDWFALENALPKIHIQSPGQVFPLHIDDLTTHRGNKIGNAEMDEHPERWARFEVQLKDWTWGHVWGIGNSYWKQWKAGDIMYHPWWEHPHGTANFSMEKRINLQVTGKVTEKTIERLNSKFEIIPI